MKKLNLNEMEASLVLFAIDVKLRELSQLPEPLASQQMEAFVKLRDDVIAFLSSGKELPMKNS